MGNHTKRAIAVESEKAMDHFKNWGTICGIAGGLGKYFLQIKMNFPERVIQAAITALVCAIVGAAGKKLFDFAFGYLKVAFKKIVSKYFKS
jgi:hypothetical protein